MDDPRIPEGTYLIPRAIARGYQVVPGVGVKDAAFPAVGLVLGITLWLVLHLFGVPFLFRALAAIVPLLLGGALAIPMDDQHLWEFARDYRGFAQTTKTLLYDWTRNDW